VLYKLLSRTGESYQRSRFSRELQRFYDWLLEAGYSRENVRRHVFRLWKVLERSSAAVSNEPRSSTYLHRAFGRYCTSVPLCGQFRATERVYCRFLSAQDRLLAGKPREDPIASLWQQYQQYLADVRGFSRRTIGYHSSTVCQFLLSALGSRQNVESLTSAHIERYLFSKSKQITRQSMQHVVAHLRAFLRYGFAHGLIRERLDAIDMPRAYRDELPPRALPWPLVQRLLSSIDRRGKAGWRDYMILHLMAHYGLRASEIAALRVNSIDWDAKTCRVEQRKTRSDLVLPLSDRTLAFQRQYLRHGRSASPVPQLFLRVRHPAGKIGADGICDIFDKRARESRLPLHGYSSYCLRHAFAMRLLERGVGVKAIGDLLGHHNLESTCVYLRLDVSALRAVALSVPRMQRS
jgi:site-specific recombinase XerD